MEAGYVNTYLIRKPHALRQSFLLFYMYKFTLNSIVLLQIIYLQIGCLYLFVYVLFSSTNHELIEYF